MKRLKKIKLIYKIQIYLLLKDVFGLMIYINKSSKIIMKSTLTVSWGG